MTDIYSNRQRILITGVSGLIGRILFHHLTTTASTEYEVFGLDQHTNISSRYQSTNHHVYEIETKYPLPLDKFLQCDITDRKKLHQIIEEQKLDIVIHLAGVLEFHPDLERILHVNIQGTKHVFEARMLLRLVEFENK